MNSQKYNNLTLDNAPWLNGKSAIEVPKKLLALALPSPGNKGVAPSTLDTDACWNDVLTCFSSLKRRLIVADFDKTASSLIAPLQETLNRVEENTMAGSIESDAVLFAILNMFNYCIDDTNLSCAIVNWLLAYKGLEYALDVLISSQNIRILYSLPFSNTQNNHYWLAPLPFKIHQLGHLSYFSTCELHFRRLLANLDEKQYVTCTNKLKAAIDQLDITRKPLIAILLPQHPEIAENLVANQKKTIPEEFAWLKLVLTEKSYLKKLKDVKLIKLGLNYMMGPMPSVIATLLVERKHEALEILIDEDSSDYLLDILANIGSPQAITKILATYSDNTKNFERLLKAVNKWPLAAIISFAEHLINFPAPNRFIKTCFNVLIAKNYSKIPLLYEWVDEAQATFLRHAIKELTSHHNNLIEINLPLVLQAPPWLNKTEQHNQKYDLQLELLPIKSLIRFTTNEITGAKQLSLHNQKMLGSAPYSVETVLSCFGLYARDEKTSELLKLAVTHVKSNNINAFINVCRIFSQYKQLSINLSIAQFLPEGFGLAIWNADFAKNILFLQIDFILTTYGDKAINGLINLPEIKFQSTHVFWFKLVTSKLAPRIANCFINHKKIKEIAKQWLIEYPTHAIYGLLPVAFDLQHEYQNSAITTLCFLARHGFKSNILDIIAQYQKPRLISEINRMLENEQLSNYPASFPPEPFYWDPDHWRLPKLKNTQQPLPKSAITHLGTMLRFPVDNGIYLGIEEVKALCDEQSLADFVWDIFQSWLDFGAPLKDNWVLSALGILGNNQTLSNLLPLLYEWPEKSFTQRTVAALDIFYLIGTDEALIHLNNYANSIKSAKLKQSAKRIISQISKYKNLSIDEIEDRAVSCLGLEVTGSLKFNIGEQTFYLTTNQNLEPILKNDSKQIIKSIPKPKYEVDMPAYNQANITFKKFKKELKQFISLQSNRLELMMCSQRTIDYSTFEFYYLKHPLLYKLVNKLVWGVFKTADEERCKGKLIQSFRICEDHSFADENENRIVLSKDTSLRIGLVHPLDLSPTQLKKFKQIFNDYQIIQPIEQLFRLTYYLNEADLLTSKLIRWKSVKVKSKGLFNLSKKTWLPIPKRNSGSLTYIEKTLDRDHYAALTFEPGLSFDNKPDEQRLVTLELYANENNTNNHLSKACFAQIDQISISELIRDVEMLVNSL